MPVTSGPNVQNTFSFGSAVDERTRNKLYGVSSGYTYLAVCLVPQWIKERGISDMRLRVKVALYSKFSGVGELTFDVGVSTSNVVELVVGELTRWRNDRLPAKSYPVFKISKIEIKVKNVLKKSVPVSSVLHNIARNYKLWEIRQTERQTSFFRKTIF